MNKVDKINISLPHEMNVYLQTAVKEGEYSSISEAMRDAIRALQYQRAERAAKLAYLKSEVLKGMSSPPAADFSFSELRKKITAKAHE